MRRKMALLTYLVIGFVDLVLAYIYLSADRFLAYHAQAMGRPWEDVGPGTQAIVLALMKVAGGGWITLGFFTIAIAAQAWIRGGSLARWALPMGTLLFYVPTLGATWTVYSETGAQAPWVPSLVAIVSALVAMGLYPPWPTRSQPRDI